MYTFFVDLGVVVYVDIDTEWVIWDFDTKLRAKFWSWSWQQSLIYITEFDVNNLARVCHSLAACPRHTPSSLAAVIGLSNNDVISLRSLRCVRCIGWKPRLRSVHTGREHGSCEPTFNTEAQFCIDMVLIVQLIFLPILFILVRVHVAGSPLKKPNIAIAYFIVKIICCYYAVIITCLVAYLVSSVYDVSMTLFRFVWNWFKVRDWYWVFQHVQHFCCSKYRQRIQLQKYFTLLQ